MYFNKIRMTKNYIEKYHATIRGVEEIAWTPDLNNILQIR